MARRGRTSPAEDFIVIASKLPWWSALLLAAVSYLALHAYSIQPIAISTAPGQAMNYLVPSILRGVASFGQYLLPMLFVIAAGLSWYKRSKKASLQSPILRTKIKTSQGASHQSPNCPVCSSAMLLREAKRGNNAGKSFWGCSNYPRCKGTRGAD